MKNRLFHRLLGWLLWKANAHPIDKDLFYTLKDRLLHQYGTRLPEIDIQCITKTCWTCGGRGEAYEDESCWKCDGSGLYARFFVELARWELGGYIFHQPGGKVSRPEDPTRPFIEGYIRHAHTSGHASYEAQLWLSLLFWPEAFRSRITEVFYAGLRSWYPLSLYARARFLIHVYGWKVILPLCRYCGKRKCMVSQGLCFDCSYFLSKKDDDDIPF